MKRNLLILGAGQYGNVVGEIAESLGIYDKIDFLDDSYILDDNSLLYFKRPLGVLDECINLFGEYTDGIVAIGNIEVRKTLTEKLERIGYVIPTLISPRAYISPSAKVEKGCVIEPLVGVNSNTVVGVGTLVSMGAVINHNAIVGEYCHIDCNSVVMGGACVGPGNHINAGNIVKKHVD